VSLYLSTVEVVEMAEAVSSPLLVSLYLSAVVVMEVADLIEAVSSLVALAQVNGQEPPFAVVEVVHVQLVVCNQSQKKIEHIWSWGEKTVLQKNPSRTISSPCVLNLSTG
jgi:hypothetical protein